MELTIALIQTSQVSVIYRNVKSHGDDVIYPSSFIFLAEGI